MHISHTNFENSWVRCVTEGNRLLDELITLRNTIEKENSKKPTIAIDRMVNKEKEIIVQKILDTAIDCGCTSGKARISSRLCCCSGISELLTPLFSVPIVLG